MKNVLLVDDDSVFNYLNAKTLERLGFASDIHTALNGKEALDLFKGYYHESQHLPDLILLDLNMPIMDGFGFLDAFQRLDLPDKEKVKIIVVSSSINNNDIQRAKDLGVSSYISKPLNEISLKAALETA